MKCDRCNKAEATVISARSVVMPSWECEPCSKEGREATEMETLRAENRRMRAERESLAILLECVDGLMMYEDKAIEAFAERKDPCPTVMTGPRKWLRRMREVRPKFPTSATKPWENP
jgi:hypothetical protein